MKPTKGAVRVPLVFVVVVDAEVVTAGKEVSATVSEVVTVEEVVLVTVGEVTPLAPREAPDIGLRVISKPSVSSKREHDACVAVETLD